MHMTRHVIAPMVIAFAMMSTVPSHAADLSVNGQIRSDGACSIALGNGGVVDLGSLSRKDLSPPGQDYMTYEREMPLTINCRYPTKASVTAIDNRYGTVSGRFLDWPAFGLGNPDLGFYWIRINGTPSKADGRDAFVIKPTVDTGFGTGWYNPGSWDALGHGSIISWGVDGPPMPESWQKEPVAFKVLTSALEIRIMLTLGKDVGVIDGMELDGSMALELGYL
ncbi:DUF1120 domain-containing protein [Burkholderia cepacia]|uniref:DUF1120 domain-containing protein n=1 Tax=Burkholderia cepacia TaxID=292 RepID=UPI001639B08F|nr:DUF1120 domain-containing protein [Burkholderia cepacia]MCA7933681.1 DUF1120 domain-containing protein [Burkholderia cepacia]